MNHYQHFFKEHKQSRLKTWEGIKSIININTAKNKSITCLNVNSTERNRLFCLKQFLQQVFYNNCKKKKKRKESNIVQTTKNYTDHLTNLSEKTYFLTPTLQVEVEEVEDIIKTLNLRKSIDPTVFQLNFSIIILKLLAFQSPNSLINLS